MLRTMEKIHTKEELLEGLKDLLAVERVARDTYQEDTEEFKDKEIIKTLKTIKLDEDEHIALLEFLIDMLDK
jgi:hypothetical protein